MTDMMATFGLDDSEYRRKMAAIMSHGQTKGSELQRHFSGVMEKMEHVLLHHAGIGRGSISVFSAFGHALGPVGLAVGALGGVLKLEHERLQKYHEDMRAAREEAEKFERVMRGGLTIDFRGDAARKLDDLSDKLKEFEDSVQERLVKSGGFHIDESVARIAEVRHRAAEEILELEARRREDFVKKRQEFFKDIAEAKGDEEGAALEGEVSTHIDKVRQLREMMGRTGIGGEDGSELMRLENERHEAAIDHFIREGSERRAKQREDLADKRRAEFEKTERDDRERRNAVIHAEMSHEMVQMELLRLGGHDREAEVLRIELETQRKIREIEQDRLMTAEQKADLSAQALEDQRNLKAAIDESAGPGRGRRAFISAGMSGGASMAQVFGGPGVAHEGGWREQVKVGQGQLKRLESMDQTLKNIERNLAMVGTYT